MLILIARRFLEEKPNLSFLTGKSKIESSDFQGMTKPDVHEATVRSTASDSIQRNPFKTLDSRVYTRPLLDEPSQPEEMEFEGDTENLTRDRCRFSSFSNVERIHTYTYFFRRERFPSPPANCLLVTRQLYSFIRSYSLHTDAQMR